jgi:hypothetical protein
MGTLAQTVLPFRVEATEEKLMANAGLTLFGEFVQGLGFSRWLAQEMPKPASGRDYPAAANVTPLVLTLTGGGRSLEDLPMLKGDKALLGLPNQQTWPLTDALGDWLRRTGAGRAWQVFPDATSASSPHGSRRPESPNTPLMRRTRRSSPKRSPHQQIKANKATCPYLPAAGSLRPTPSFSASA